MLYLVCERPDWNAKSSSQPKVGKLEGVGAAVDEQVLRLQIPMQHSVRVAVCCALEDLVHVRLQCQEPTKRSGRIGVCTQACCSLLSSRAGS